MDIVKGDENNSGKEEKLDESTASSLAFLGSLLLEHSAIEQSEIFVKRSCELSEFKSPDSFLSLLHLYELRQGFAKSFIHAERHLRSAPENGISLTISKEAAEKGNKLSKLLPEMANDNKYSKLLYKNDDGSYTYKLANEIFTEPFLKAKLIVD